MPTVAHRTNSQLALVPVLILTGSFSVYENPGSVQVPPFLVKPKEYKESLLYMSADVHTRVFTSAKI
jgi:hypothetical protein